jgi:hypothetical protein
VFTCVGVMPPAGPACGAAGVAGVAGVPAGCATVWLSRPMTPEITDATVAGSEIAVSLV